MRKARETLERSIKLVEETPKWGAKVIYGDTDRYHMSLDMQKAHGNSIISDQPAHSYILVRAIAVCTHLWTQDSGVLCDHIL